MKHLIWALPLLSYLFTGCHTAETQYPSEPYIELRDQHFIKGVNFDTVTVTLYVRDGDFDLGLLQKDTLFPFNWRTYFLKTGEPVNSNYASLIPMLLTYKDKRLHLADSLPPYTKPFFCSNWQPVISHGRVVDTVYFRKNPDYFNYRVDFYYQENGRWNKFNFDMFSLSPTICALDYNSRFVPFSDNMGPFKGTKISRQEGLLTYTIRAGSPALETIFGASRPVKLRISITDKALNKSNEIETGEFIFK